jgi:integrase
VLGKSSSKAANTEEHFRQVQAVNLGTTFVQQSEWWLRHLQERKRKPVKPHTISSWTSHLKWINSRLGDTALSNVNNLKLKALVSEMAEAEFQPKTIANYAQVVKMVVASAIGDDGEERYPRKWNSEFIDLPTVEAQRTPTFTSSEVEQVILAAEGQFQMLYVLLAATGLRIGEALALEVQHFGCNVAVNGTLTISQGLWNRSLQTPKTRNGFREVDIAANVTEMLKAFIGDRTSGFIFRTAGGSPLHQSNLLRRDLHPLLARILASKAGFHSFRRFRVTHLRKQNTPEDLLRFWIGHGDKTVTDRYAKLKQDIEYRKAVAERVGIGFNLEVVPRCPPNFEPHSAKQAVVM